MNGAPQIDYLIAHCVKSPWDLLLWYNRKSKEEVEMKYDQLFRNPEKNDYLFVIFMKYIDYRSVAIRVVICRVINKNYRSHDSPTSCCV